MIISSHLKKVILIILNWISTVSFPIGKTTGKFNAEKIFMK